MKYITKEDLKNDNRFFIDDRNIDRLMRQPILRYEVQRKKIGMLLRTRANTNRIVTLYKTRVYAYLAGNDEGKKEYDEYIDICNVSFRSREAYNNLIEALSSTPYDIAKGAIVVNQDDLIYDGQHRSCYLLFKYGPNYKVDVLKLFFETNRGLGYIIHKVNLFLTKTQAFLICCFDKRVL